MDLCIRLVCFFSWVLSAKKDLSSPVHYSYLFCESCTLIFVVRLNFVLLCSRHRIDYLCSQQVALLSWWIIYAREMSRMEWLLFGKLELFLKVKVHFNCWRFKEKYCISLERYYNIIWIFSNCLAANIMNVVYFLWYLRTISWFVSNLTLRLNQG